MKKPFFLSTLALIVAVTSGAAIPAEAQFIPSKTIEFVVHGGPGSGNDVARTATIIEQEKLAPVRLQVVNKPGGGSAAAASYVASRNPEVPGRLSHEACRSGGAALRLSTACLNTNYSFDSVGARSIDLLRIKIQLQLLAHDAGEEAAHRMLLPAGCLHHCGDCGAVRDRSIVITRDCFEPATAS
jgi:hypothetical protein